MKNIILLSIITLFAFTGCEQLCSEQKSQLAHCNSTLLGIQTELAVSKTDLSNAINKADSLQLEKAQLQAGLQNCNSTLSQNTAAYQASLNNKQVEIQSLTNALNAKTIAYDELYSLHTGLLNDNYVIFKPNIIKQLTELNALVFEGETALNQLNNIEPKDEIVLEAIKTTEIALAHNKGKRSAIGQLTGVQVQN